MRLEKHIVTLTGKWNDLDGKVLTNKETIICRRRGIGSSIQSYVNDSYFDIKISIVPARDVS